MRVFSFLFCLLFILAACGALGQTSSQQRVPTETPLSSLAQPSAAPIVVRSTATPALVQPSAALTVVQPTTTPALAQPSATPLPGSGVLLAVHDPLDSRDEIHLVDPETGQDVPDYPPFLTVPYLLSPDGKQLAAIESHGQSCEASGGGTACRWSADVLHLVDLHSWREVTVTLSAQGWAGPSSFHPASRSLAVVINEQQSSTLLLFDTGTGQAITQRSLPFRPTLMQHTEDGTMLAIYGQPLSSNPGMVKPDPPRVLLLDATTLDITWEQQLASILSGDWCLENCQASHEKRLFASWIPAVVFSSDGRKLYLVHADAERLTTVDFIARSVSSVDIQTAQGWVEKLLDLAAGVAEAKGGTNGAAKTAVLAPDGTKLYLIGGTYTATRDPQGDWQNADDSLGLQVIDVASGRKLASYDTRARWWIRISPDGTFVFLTDSDGQQWSTEVIDTNSLQRVAQLEKWEVLPTRRLDGQPILLASQLPGQPSQLAVLDPRSFAVMHSWSVNGYASWVTTP